MSKICNLLLFGICLCDSRTFRAITKQLHTNIALHHSLDKFDAQEYHEAMGIVPTLVEQETPIALFLRGALMDPIQAARRLARFWKYRKILFADRWLLPMSQTGAGALNAWDIRMVQTGYNLVLRLPNEKPLFLASMGKAFHVLTDAHTKGIDTLALVERCAMYFGVVHADILSQGNATMMHSITPTPHPMMEVRTKMWEVRDSVVS